MPGIPGQKLVRYEDIQDLFNELGYVTPRPRDRTNHGFPICVEYMGTLRVIFCLGGHYQADRFLFEEDGSDILQKLSWVDLAELYWKPRKKLGVMKWCAPMYDEERDYVKVKVEDFVKLCRQRIEQNELLGTQKAGIQDHSAHVSVSHSQSKDRDGQREGKEERISPV